jgi:hypothetical protein
MDKQAKAALEWALSSIENHINLASKNLEGFERKLASLTGVVYHDKKKEQQKEERIADTISKQGAALNRLQEFLDHKEAILKLLGAK